MDDKIKICGSCKQITNFVDLKKNKQRKDGIGSWCKKCNNQSYKQYYENNKNLILEKKQVYRENNKDQIHDHNNKANVCIVCNGNFTNIHKSIHEKSKKHQNILNKINKLTSEYLNDLYDCVCV